MDNFYDKIKYFLEYGEWPEKVEAKIVRRDGKWYVYDKTGKKKLAGPYSSRQQALKRLREIEFFKHKK